MRWVKLDCEQISEQCLESLVDPFLSFEGNHPLLRLSHMCEVKLSFYMETNVCCPSKLDKFLKMLSLFECVYVRPSFLRELLLLMSFAGITCPNHTVYVSQPPRDEFLGLNTDKQT